MDTIHVDVGIPSQPGVISPQGDGQRGEAPRVPSPAPSPPPATLDDVIARVEHVGVALFRWRALAADLASQDERKRNAALLEMRQRAGRPSDDASYIAGTAVTEGPHLSDAELMGGTHVTELLEELRLADAFWPPRAGAAVSQGLAEAAPLLAATLERATQHVAILILWRKAQRARLGVSVNVAKELSRWVLSSDDAAKVTNWVAVARPRFHDRGDAGFVEVKLEPTYLVKQGVLLGAPQNRFVKWSAAASVIWAPVAGLVALWAAINVIALAGVRAGAAHIDPVTLDPRIWNSNPADPDGFARLAALFALVGGGAILHLGSKAIAAVNFDNGLEVQGKDGALSDWFAMRWASYLRLWLLVAVAAGVTYVAKPELLATADGMMVAILAGFGADSLLRTAVTRMDEKNQLDGKQSQLAADKLRADQDDAPLPAVLGPH